MDREFIRNQILRAALYKNETKARESARDLNSRVRTARGHFSFFFSNYRSFIRAPVCAYVFVHLFHLLYYPN